MSNINFKNAGDISKNNRKPVLKQRARTNLRGANNPQAKSENKRIKGYGQSNPNNNTVIELCNSDDLQSNP